MKTFHRPQRPQRRGQAIAAQLPADDGPPDPAAPDPCLFDPEHGPSSTVATWTTSRFGTRQVPVCEADAARLAHRQQPATRTVDVDGATVPYWAAGEAASAYVACRFARPERFAWLWPDAVQPRGTTKEPPPHLPGTYIDTMGGPSGPGV